MDTIRLENFLKEISMNLQTKLKKLQGAKSMYDFALDIGISASILRNYYLGKRLLKWNFEKIENFVKENK